MCFTSHAGLQAAFDADWQAGRITSDSYRNGTEDGALAYKLLIQTGSKKEPFNYSQVCPRAARSTLKQNPHVNVSVWHCGQLHYQLSFLQFILTKTQLNF